MRRDHSKIIFRTVVFAGAMLGGAACVRIMPLGDGAITIVEEDSGETVEISVKTSVEERIRATYMHATTCNLKVYWK